MAVYKGGRECNYNVWREMETHHTMSDTFPEGQTNRDWNGRSDRSRKDWHDRYKEYLDDDERGWSEYEERRPRFQNDSYKRHFRDERRGRDRSESRRSFSYSPPAEEKTHEFPSTSRESRHRSRGHWDYEENRDRCDDRNWKRHSRETISPSGSSGDVYYGRERRRPRVWEDEDDAGRRRSRVWEEEEEAYHSYYYKEKDPRPGVSSEGHSYEYRSNGVGGSRHAEEKNYKSLPPSNTIIIRGLVPSITENDIWQAVIETTIIPGDIRLIRKKCTGEIRGFAFVSFDSVEEAIRFIDLKQGSIMLQGKYRATVEFSMPKVSAPKYDSILKTTYRDWSCDHCGFTNFKNRDVCFKCKVANTRASSREPDNNEVSHYPTQTVLLKGLDVLSTEESVLQSLTKITSVPIRNIRIAHDPLTKTSLGICYIEMHSVIDSAKLFNALTAEPFMVDGKKIQVSYRKIIQIQKNAALVSASTDLQSQTTIAGDSKVYTLEDIPSLAEYSASLYAKTPQEHATYLQYYTEYYKTHVLQGDAAIETLSNISKPAQSAGVLYSQEGTSKDVESTPQDTQSTVKSFPFVSESTQLPQYPVPDVSTYKYDKTSGYYYDAQTGLYYDASSQYYYNSSAQQFLYWDSEKQTYAPVPTSSSDANVSKDENKKEQEKNTGTKQDKIKVAKKIVKDMERWAKVLNQKRDTAKHNIVAPSIETPASKPVGSADAGFSVLERQESFTVPVVPEPQPRSPIMTSVGLGLVYERELPKPQVDEVEEHTNWSKLACLLCKRQFQSKESLVKHQQESSLHKSNLQKWRQSQAGSNSSGQSFQHSRDTTFSLNSSSGNSFTPKGALKSFGLQNLEQYAES